MASDERLSNLKFRDPPSAIYRASPRLRQCLFQVEEEKKREYPQSRIWPPNAMLMHSSSCGWAAPMSDQDSMGHRGKLERSNVDSTKLRWAWSQDGIFRCALGRLPHATVARAL